MKAVNFPGSNLIIAENQPEYLPLPAYVGGQPIAPEPGGCPICGSNVRLESLAGLPRFECGSYDFDQSAGTIHQSEGCRPPEAVGISFCMELTEEERATVAKTGVIWHSVLTFGGKLQPQQMTVEKPDWIPAK